jgi:hypothetical protein
VGYTTLHVPRYTTLQETPLSLKAVGEGLLPLQKPLKPGCEPGVPPFAGIEEFQETLLMVTALPV